VTATTPPSGTAWHIQGQEVVSCNCDWGCPCQFNALPTHGFCEAIVTIAIEHGHFGDVMLDGITYTQVFHWDGAIHQGNGWRRLIVDERTSPEQRAAIAAMTSGNHGHPVFEIFSAMAPNALEPAAAPIALDVDREKRRARLRIPGIAESDVEPIRNPVTGKEHRARIDLPNGFEYRRAEMGNSVRWQATAGERLAMAHENTYAQLAPIDWSSDGTTG